MDEDTVNNIGNEFIKSYYELYDGGRDERMKQFYNAESTLQFEDDVFTGQEAIYNKIRDLPYQVVKHDFLNHVSKCYTEPDVWILALGHLKFGDEPNRTFAESFMGRKIDGSFIVMQQVFRFQE